ncbi:MAG: roadblock/LC7 domain-containing protein [Candidatus Lokiarchaeota archaeon]|nr:roadblock/LC7 domain-containing protein [Candidatus Lokiarchaeota archaeon]
MSKESSEQQRDKDIQQIIDEIKKKGNLNGVIFSYKEGRMITENLEAPLDKSVFSSMFASVLESASSLGKSSGGLKLKKIITELISQTIIIIECTDKTFLALFVNENSETKKILNDIDSYIRKIILLFEQRKKEKRD